eukprot:4042925-Lingulodinium_polyedra.AAC.1
MVNSIQRHAHRNKSGTLGRDCGTTYLPGISNNCDICNALITPYCLVDHCSSVSPNLRSMNKMWANGRTLGVSRLATPLAD